MFTVAFRQDYGTPITLNLNSVSEIISLSGFDALNYTASVSQTGLPTVWSSFTFRPQPFSVVLFITSPTRSGFLGKLNQIQAIFRQYRFVDNAHRFIIQNQETGTEHQAPALIETVSITKQTGFSATVAITGIRRTQGLFVGSLFSPISVSTSASGLPKTVSVDYPYSFPAPLRIDLTGPINAGFQISRNDGQPRFDFTLTVGTAIPSGVTVGFDYRFAYAGGSNLVYNAKYLANPEIAPDVVIRPQSVTGNATNTFTLSGPSSSGTVTFTVNPMSWSIYE